MVVSWLHLGGEEAPHAPRGSVRGSTYATERMFQSSAKRLRTWLRFAEDVLGDPPVQVPPHPHRRPLRWERERRAGSVAPRPAHCLSSVRPVRDAVHRDQAAR